MMTDFFHLYGLLIGIGALVGLMVSKRMSKYMGVNPTWIDEAFIYLAVGALLGARIYHILTDWRLYQGASFWDYIAVWRGGVGFLGALLGGIIGFIIWLLLIEKKHPIINNQRSITMRMFTYLDILVFGIPVAQAIGRLGNYINRELYGLPTSLPWGIVISGKKYHPLFLYEALCNLVLFCILLMLARKKALVLGKGQYAALYLFGYALMRFWLEFLRIETARLDGRFGIFSTAQWVTLIMMFLAPILFWVRRHACPPLGRAPKKQFDWSLK